VTVKVGGSKKTQTRRQAKMPLLELELFVSGTTPKSVRAIANIKEICERYLDGRREYRLQIIDIYKEVPRSNENQIIAVPTLVKSAPLPRRVFIGDLSEKNKVLRSLGIYPSAPMMQVSKAGHDTTLRSAANTKGSV
jgi:circadian clock protein KaiB